MAPRKWSTEAQWDWLMGRNHDWRDSQKANTTTPWIAGTCHEWFAAWCEEDAEFGKGSWQRPFMVEEHERLAQAIEARKLKIQTWYHNHGHKNTGQSGKTVKASAPETIPRVKSSRALQEIEIYSKRHYESKVKSDVKAELRRVAAERGVPKLPKKERLAIVRAFTAQAYENESDEVKREITQAAVEDKERCHALAQAVKKPVTNPTAERTPEEYQHAIDHGPVGLRRAIAPFSWGMGCCITVIVSGPMPDQGGAIGSFAVHEGTNALGHNFAQITPTFRNSFARPHVQFAKGVYPEDVRKRRALPPSVTGIPLPEATATHPLVIPTPVLPPPEVVARVVATPMVILEECDKLTRPCRPPTPIPSSLPAVTGVPDPLQFLNQLAPDADVYSSNSAQGFNTQPLGMGSASFGMGSAPFGMGSAPLGMGSAPFGMSSAPFGMSSAPFGMGDTSFGMGNTSFGMGSSALPNARQTLMYDDFGMPVTGSFSDALNNMSLPADHAGLDDPNAADRYMFPDLSAGLSVPGIAPSTMPYPDLSPGLTVPNTAATMHAFPEISDATMYPDMSPGLAAPPAPSVCTIPGDASSLLQSFAPREPSVTVHPPSPTSSTLQEPPGQDDVAQPPTQPIQPGDDGHAAEPDEEDTTDAQEGTRRTTRARRKPNKADNAWEARPRAAAGKENQANAASKKRKDRDVSAEGGSAKKQRKITR